jgi:hypothetical protein
MIRLGGSELNSVALVRKRTIQTERPPLDGEVSANFADIRCRVVRATNSHGRYSLCSRPEVRREVLYKILIEFGVPMKLVS